MKILSGTNLQFKMEIINSEHYKHFSGPKNNIKLKVF